MAAISSIIAGSIIAGIAGAGTNAIVANQQRIKAEREGNRQKAEQENLLAQAQMKERDNKLLQEKSGEQQDAFRSQQARRASKPRGTAAMLYGGSDPVESATSATGAGGAGKTLLGT